MKIFITLLKCDLLRLFGINKALHGKNSGDRKKIIGLCVLGFFVAVLAIGMSVLYSALFAMILPEGQKHLSLAIIYTFYTLMVVISTLITSAGVVFGCKDYDIVMALPVKPSVIALAKSGYVYILNLIIAVLIMLPAGATYGTVTGTLATVIPLCLVFLPFAPLPALIVGFIFGTVVAIIAARMKRTNIAGIFLTLLFVVAYFAFIFGMQNVNDENAIAIVGALSGIIAPATYVALGLSGNILYLAIFIVGFSALAAGYMALVGKFYKKINTLVMTKRSGGKYVMKKQRRGKLMQTLIKREFSTWSSSATVVMNTAIGALMLIVFSAAFMIGGDNFLSQFSSSQGGEINASLSLIKYYLTSFLPLLHVFFIGLSYYAACSVSLEGKSLWIIKSLPVPAKRVFAAKILMNLFITIPAGVLSVAFFGIGFHATVLDILLSEIIVIMYCVFGAGAGLLINLRFPFLDWTTQAEAVKRGTAPMIVSLGGMFAVVPLGLIVFFSLAVSRYLGWGLVALILGVVIAVIYSVLGKDGEKMYVKL